MKMLRRWVSFLGIAAALCGCAVNPVTGERELALVSESQEIAMGKQGAEQVQQTMALVEDPELQAYVDRLGQQLAAASERPELPWSFAVVDDPTPNAFALPGGPIFVTRGLLGLMDSEAELVTVIGHEIGHITARHSVAQMSRAQLAQLGLGVGMILVPEVRPLGDVAGLGLNLLMLKYGRDAERQADDLGFRYARTQGYDVSEMADVFAALQRAGELAGQSPIPNWMASHPAPQERIEAVEERLRNAPPDQFESTVGRSQFLGMLEGLAYGENPRNGFFRDDVFYHPDLRFRFAVPPEWQRQNLPRAVMGVSPAENAAFQFTLAPAPSAAEAMRAFASQQGLQVGPTSSDRINGLSAATAAFQAQAQQGVVAGYVAFYEQGDKVYQLVTYSPAEAFEGYRQTFQTMIDSFAPLTDPAILNVQPAEIGIARLPRSMNLVEFARWSESTIPLEELALINQVQNVEATIEADTLLKQVRGGVGKD
ncbi:M48 family metalloprotease [Proteobacteria bacterium 005FR1]|nr:M48 family metalloprotease [Proteobacteria bacterium 005FR1]